MPIRHSKITKQRCLHKRASIEDWKTCKGQKVLRDYCVSVGDPWNLKCEDPPWGISLPTHTHMSSSESWEWVTISSAMHSKSNIHERGIPLNLQMIVLHIPRTRFRKGFPWTFRFLPQTQFTSALSSFISFVFSNESASHPHGTSNTFAFHFIVGFAGNLNCIIRFNRDISVSNRRHAFLVNRKLAELFRSHMMRVVVGSKHI